MGGNGARDQEQPVGDLTVAGATPGVRFMLMAGKPDGEATLFNGPFVD